MSFITIKDPNSRDKIVEDYIKLKHDLRIKSENDRAEGLQQQQELEKTFSPIIKATKESTKEITKELQTNRGITENEQGYWKPNFTKPAIDYYLGLTKNVDKNYGIQKRGDHYEMGQELVTLDDRSNITVDGRTFEGTPGLWQLIMLARPTNYTDEDFSNYEDLVENTQVIFHPLKKSAREKPKSTIKYKEILSKLEQKYQSTSGDIEEEPEEEPEEEQKMTGQGIKFLPGNINGLLERLKLLCAERQAGNIKSTTNEIVSILDELQRMKQLSQEQYNALCKELLC